MFVTLLIDEEPEVKAAAVSKLTDVGAMFSKSSGADLFIEESLPKLEKLVNDPSDFVRTEVASVIFAMAPIVGREKTIAHLVPLFLLLLRDTDSQVRLNLIGSLDLLEGTIEIDYLKDALLPCIQDLAVDSAWRIRFAIIEHLPLVAKHVGQKVFDLNLIEHCMKWLRDEVYSIREAATKNLRHLTEFFGEEWAKEQLFEKIKEQAQDPSYLFRMQALRSIESLSPVISQEALNTNLLEHIVLLAKDPTPNIKFNVAKCLESIADKLTPAVLTNDVKPLLKNLGEDEDEDVRFYALRAMDVVSKVLAGDS